MPTSLTISQSGSKINILQPATSDTSAFINGFSYSFMGNTYVLWDTAAGVLPIEDSGTSTVLLEIDITDHEEGQGFLFNSDNCIITDYDKDLNDTTDYRDTENLLTFTYMDVGVYKPLTNLKSDALRIIKTDSQVTLIMPSVDNLNSSLEYHENPQTGYIGTAYTAIIHFETQLSTAQIAAFTTIPSPDATASSYSIGPTYDVAGDFNNQSTIGYRYYIMDIGTPMTAILEPGTYELFTQDMISDLPNILKLEIQLYANGNGLEYIDNITNEYIRVDNGSIGITNTYDQVTIKLPEVDDLHSILQYSTVGGVTGIFSATVTFERTLLDDEKSALNSTENYTIAHRSEKLIITAKSIIEPGIIELFQKDTITGLPKITTFQLNLTINGIFQEIIGSTVDDSVDTYVITDSDGTSSIIEKCIVIDNYGGS